MEAALDNSADVKMGVDVVMWFLAFSTCGWNALSEQTLHQRCQAVGRRRGKTRCVETACLQDSSGQGSTGGGGGHNSKQRCTRER